MVKVVIKKKGKKEKFNLRKIKRCLECAAQQAKSPKKKKDKVIKDILDRVMDYSTNQEELTTAEIRDLVLMELNILDDSIMKAWLAHEMMKIRKKSKHLHHSTLV